MLKPRVIENFRPHGQDILSIHPDAKNAANVKNEKWYLVNETDVAGKDGEGHIQEIFWRGHTVVIMYFDKYHNEYQLKNCFSVETDIKDVIYTNFQLEEKHSEFSRCLCVLEKSCLNVLTPVGELLVASLPFKVKKMWSIQNGVCVEREAGTKDSDEKGMPTLFSLTHPLEDFKPVVYQYQDSKKSMYFTDVTQNIVFTSPSKSYVMSYDSTLGLHSLWKAREALEQDFPEIASHQDSLPEFLGFNSQSSFLAPLKGGPSRISTSPSVQNKRHSCPPIPIHLQQKASPNRHGSPMSKGYSPSHKAPPYHGHAHHDAHETSIASEINGSKRSHITSMMMFRMSCADTKLEEEVEPLPPNVCLEQVWQEQGNMIRYGTKGRSEGGFLTYDLYGSCYIGYLIKGLSKLRLIKLQHSKFEKVIELDCIDAGTLLPCSMFAILDLSQNIHLYTGKQKYRIFR